MFRHLTCIALCFATAHVTAATWTPAQLGAIRSLSLDALPPLPASPSNAVADSAAAARLGRRLFFDPSLSRDGTVSCASCHEPARLFTDGKPRGEGVGVVARNTPTLLGVAWFDWLYWDGRKDSLWSQALAPLEASAEMANSRVGVLRAVYGDTRHRAQYRRAFGVAPPALPGKSHASPYGGPAERRAWRRLDDARRDEIDTAFANVGKALAAWQRTLRPAASPLDAYAAALDAGEPTSALSADAEAGLALFIDDERTGCMRCHNGARLSNGDFHNVGTGNFGAEHLDFGRALGQQAVVIDRFNCLGKFSDAAPEQCSALRFLSNDNHGLRGAFRTPTLRGLRFTAPYFHDGSRATLADVLAHYLTPPPGGDQELQPLALKPSELRQLEAFLLSLSPLQAPAVQ